MAILRVEKVVAVLPPVLAANTVYFVRVGAGFDLYTTDQTGAIAHKVNGTASSTEKIDRVDYSGAQYQYLGYPSKITRVNVTVSPPVVQSVVTADLDADWTNRATLTYT